MLITLIVCLTIINLVMAGRWKLLSGRNHYYRLLIENTPAYQ